jgi:hypothetical protein
MCVPARAHTLRRHAATAKELRAPPWRPIARMSQTGRTRRTIRAPTTNIWPKWTGRTIADTRILQFLAASVAGGRPANRAGRRNFFSRAEIAASVQRPPRAPRGRCAPVVDMGASAIASLPRLISQVTRLAARAPAASARRRLDVCSPEPSAWRSFCWECLRAELEDTRGGEGW